MGNHMEIIWKSYGNHMEIIWKSHGNHMEITWKSYGIHEGSCVVSIEFLATSQKAEACEILSADRRSPGATQGMG